MLADTAAAITTDDLVNEMPNAVAADEPAKNNGNGRKNNLRRGPNRRRPRNPNYKKPEHGEQAEHGESNENGAYLAAVASEAVAVTVIADTQPSAPPPASASYAADFAKQRSPEPAAEAIERPPVPAVEAPKAAAEPSFAPAPQPTAAPVAAPSTPSASSEGGGDN